MRTFNHQKLWRRVVLWIISGEHLAMNFLLVILDLQVTVKPNKTRANYYRNLLKLRKASRLQLTKKKSVKRHRNLSLRQVFWTHRSQNLFKTQLYPLKQSRLLIIRTISSLTIWAKIIHFWDKLNNRYNKKKMRNLSTYLILDLTRN